jgi:hypothetical protein
MPIVRKKFITDKNGIEHEITSKADLQRILDQMTPEEFERWKTQYRFSPINVDLGNWTDYSGLLRDLD